MTAYYTPYSETLKQRGFGGLRIRKVTLNGGFTCPNLDGTKGRGGCVFCDNRGFSPVAERRGAAIETQLEEGIRYSRVHFEAQKFIAYFQPFSGTYAPVTRLRESYERALRHPDVIGLSIGTRPDCVTAEIVELLEEFSRKTYLTLELGLQSSDDGTLNRINRGHTFSEFSAAMDLCRNRGFDVCVHVILGLPGETTTHHRNTALSLNRWPYHSIKIHPLHIVKGTPLAEDFARGRYAPLEFEKYVEEVVGFLEHVPARVGVQRFTGDAKGELLIAPQWCREKNIIRNAMIAEFRRRNSRQGTGLHNGSDISAN